MRQLFTNTTTLAGLVWRRDRIQIPIWVLSLVLFTVTIAAAFPALYPPGPERQIIAQTFTNPALISMLGPAYGIDNYHLGAIMAHQMLLFTMVAVAIMNILLTIRHTRRDEELGRIEVVQSLPVGRLSNAASAMLVLSVTNVAIGLACSIGLGFLGLEGMNWVGSVFYGAALTVTGLFFAASTLLFAQLTETSRGAMAYSFGFLGLSYLLRAVGDISSEALSLISPLGLVLRAQVYVNNYFWPLGLALLGAVLLTVLAFRLNMARDLEAGFVPAKPGPSQASRFLERPLGLVIRLERTTIIGWTIGLFILGASYGSVFGDVDEFVKTSELYQQFLPNIAGATVIGQFVAMLLSLMAMMAAVPALLIMLKLSAEEKVNRTEQLLASPVPRIELMGSFLGTALVTAVIMQVVSVVGLWAGASAVVEDPFSLGSALKGALVYVPVIWVLVGLAALLIGFAPKVVNLTWLYLGYTFFAVYFGNLLKVPEWMRKLSPWGHIPNVPLEPVSPATVFTTLALSLALMGLGLYGYKKRDISG